MGQELGVGTGKWLGTGNRELGTGTEEPELGTGMRESVAILAQAILAQAQYLHKKDDRVWWKTASDFQEV